MISCRLLWIVGVVSSNFMLSVAATIFAKHHVQHSLETRDLSDGEKQIEPNAVSSTVVVDENDASLGTRMQQTQLQFHGEYCHDQVFTVPKTTTDMSTRQLFSFFQNKDHRNLLLKGGGNPTMDIPKTPELLAEWTAQSRSVSSTPPIPLQAFNNQNDDAAAADFDKDGDDHAVVAIHSTVPLVPGLSIEAISYTGCRLLSHPQTKLPMYEFTLIQDRYQARGTKPLVWIYRKITGEAPTTSATMDKNHRRTSWSSSNHPLAAAKSTTGSRTTKGLCRVALEHEGGETWRLSYYSMINVSCSLPQKLLQLLPLGKQKVEAKISATMVKQLEREILDSADKFHSALQAWLSRRPHTHN